MGDRKKRIAEMDIAELQSKLRTTLKPGTVTSEGDKLFVRVGRVKKEIPSGGTTEKAEIRKMVGKEVAVAVSRNSIVAIGRRVVPCYWIICYIPAPELLKRVHVDVRRLLIQKFVAEGIISKEFAQELRSVQ